MTKRPEQDETLADQNLAFYVQPGAILITVFLIQGFLLVNLLLGNNFLAIEGYSRNHRTTFSSPIMSRFLLKYDFLAFYARLKLFLKVKKPYHHVSSCLSNSSNYFLVVLC